MTREEIIRLAREAGFQVASASYWGAEREAIERFAARGAAAAREACAMTLLETAKVFVKRVDDCVPTIFFFEYQKEYNNLCAAIAEHEQASDVASRTRPESEDASNAIAKFLEWHAEVVKLAVLAEREACAKVADEYPVVEQAKSVTLGVAARIRARGKDE
jgi:hypothetical protein